jgi:hypothetical protein
MAISVASLRLNSCGKALKKAAFAITGLGLHCAGLVREAKYFSNDYCNLKMITTFGYKKKSNEKLLAVFFFLFIVFIECKVTTIHKYKRKRNI